MNLWKMNLWNSRGSFRFASSWNTKCLWCIRKSVEQFLRIRSSSRSWGILRDRSYPHRFWTPSATSFTPPHQNSCLNALLISISTTLSEYQPISVDPQWHHWNDKHSTYLTSSSKKPVSLFHHAQTKLRPNYLAHSNFQSSLGYCRHPAPSPLL